MTVKITRSEFSGEELRRRQGAFATQPIAPAVGAGSWRALLAARPPGTLAWTGRLCATGFTALTRRASTGCPIGLAAAASRGLNEGQLAEFDKIVETPPDPVADGVVRWRCVDLKNEIAKRFGVALSTRSVGRILKERGFRKLSARPKHPEVNTAAQDDFRQTLPRS